jgi:hypothetical protein
VSRHRRQQNKRFRRGLDRVPRHDIVHGLRIWERRGIITRMIDPTARLAVRRAIKRGEVCA